jgi:hypothetical protein
MPEYQDITGSTLLEKPCTYSAWLCELSIPAFGRENGGSISPNGGSIFSNGGSIFSNGGSISPNGGSIFPNSGSIFPNSGSIHG